MSSGPPLDPRDVDDDGDGYAENQGDCDDGDTFGNARADELRQNYETRMTQSLEDIIGRVVGFGKVRVNVTADMNFDRVTTNQELYDPEQQVVRSTQTVNEQSRERGDDRCFHGAPRCGERCTIIAQVALSRRDVTDRIEGAVGRDLQFIRINGTLVGGLVGLAIHGIDVLL